MEKQSQRGTGIIRTAVFAVNVVRQKHRLHFLGFVVAVEKIAKASSEERNQLRNFFTPHSSKSFSHAQHFEPTPGAATRRIGRRLQEKWLKITRQFFQLIVHADERLRIARR